jgi:hypothetical protein
LVEEEEFDAVDEEEDGEGLLWPNRSSSLLLLLVELKWSLDHVSILFALDEDEDEDELVNASELDQLLLLLLSLVLDRLVGAPQSSSWLADACVGLTEPTGVLNAALACVFA